METLREPMISLGVISLNSLQYGNPRLEQKFIMDEGCIIDSYLDEFKELFPPQNSNERVKQEMNLVKEKMKSLSNPQLREEYMAIDKDLRAYAAYYCSNLGVLDAARWFDEMNVATGSFILKLKYWFQRPRPYQLASLFDMELFPMHSCSSLSPAFPSGHTFQAFLIESWLKAKGVENNFSELVARSRVALGLHYPSDNQGSFEIAQKIIEKPEIKQLINGK